MAIEILTPGVVPDTFFYGTCHGCNAHVRFDKSDAVSSYVGDQREGAHASIRCPTDGCGRIIHGYPKRN